jgi:hypothetical protein
MKLGKFSAFTVSLANQLHPIEESRHIAKREGVVVRGCWIREAEIQSRLQKIVEANAK